MKYKIALQPLVTVEIEADDPMAAAHSARDRVLGLLRETPAAIQSIGFMPDYPWFVFDGKVVVAEGKDNDLSPREMGAMSE